MIINVNLNKLSINELMDVVNAAKAIQENVCDYIDIRIPSFEDKCVYNGCIYTIHKNGIKTGFKKHSFCLREHIHELVNANAGIRY